MCEEIVLELLVSNNIKIFSSQKDKIQLPNFKSQLSLSNQKKSIKTKNKKKMFFIVCAVERKNKKALTRENLKIRPIASTITFSGN